MRRVPILALVTLLLASAAAGAEILYVEKGELVPDPDDPSVLSFFLEIREPGSYQVRLLVRGESEKQIELQLRLQPQEGGPARTVPFAFTGRGCG